MLPRTCFSPAPFHRRLGGGFGPRGSAEPAIHQGRRLTKCGDIEFALPDFVSSYPPVPNACLARPIVRIDHAPMLERPLVVAPTALAISGRPVLPARPATARNVCPDPLGFHRRALRLAGLLPRAPIELLGRLIPLVGKCMNLVVIAVRQGIDKFIEFRPCLSRSSGHFRLELI